jgi:hypothetical protein
MLEQLRAHALEVSAYVGANVNEHSSARLGNETGVEFEKMGRPCEERFRRKMTTKVQSETVAPFSPQHSFFPICRKKSPSAAACWRISKQSIGADVAAAALVVASDSFDFAIRILPDANVNPFSSSPGTEASNCGAGAT